MLWLAWKGDLKAWSPRDSGDDYDDEMAVILENGYQAYDKHPRYNDDIDNDSDFWRRRATEFAYTREQNQDQQLKMETCRSGVEHEPLLLYNLNKCYHFLPCHGYVNRRGNPLLLQMNLPKSTHHTNGNLGRGQWHVTCYITVVVRKIFPIVIFHRCQGESKWTSFHFGP